MRTERPRLDGGTEPILRQLMAIAGLALGLLLALTAVPHASAQAQATPPATCVRRNIPNEDTLKGIEAAEQGLLVTALSADQWQSLPVGAPFPDVHLVVDQVAQAIQVVYSGSAVQCAQLGLKTGQLIQASGSREIDVVAAVQPPAWCVRRPVPNPPTLAAMFPNVDPNIPPGTVSVVSMQDFQSVPRGPDIPDPSDAEFLYARQAMYGPDIALCQNPGLWTGHLIQVNGGAEIDVLAAAASPPMWCVRRHVPNQPTLHAMPSQSITVISAPDLRLPQAFDIPDSTQDAANFTQTIGDIFGPGAIPCAQSGRSTGELILANGDTEVFVVALGQPPSPSALCMRQATPPPPPDGGAVLAGPLDPSSAEPNVVVLPTEGRWRTGDCGAATMSQPTSISVASPLHANLTHAALFFKDDVHGLQSAWGSVSVDGSSAPPVLFPGRNDFTTTSVYVFTGRPAIPKFLADLNSCRGCPLAGYDAEPPVPLLLYATTVPIPYQAYTWSLAGADLRGSTLSPGSGEPQQLSLAHWDLSGANLSGVRGLDQADLSGANLSGADLSTTIFYAANLSGANLSNANLSHVNLAANVHGANLTNANMRQVRALEITENLNSADFSGALLDSTNLDEVNLSGARLRGANLSGSSILYTDLSMADLSGANLSGSRIDYADLSGADLSGSNLTNTDLTLIATLKGANMSGANLNGANAYKVDLSGVNLAKSVDLSTVFGLNYAVLSDTNLSGTVLDNVYLIGADLRGANLSRSSLDSANLDQADLSGADLTDAALEKSQNLKTANLAGANLSGANLDSLDMRSASLPGADLRQASLSSTDLADADLTGADLRATDLTTTIFQGANLGGANLSGANMHGTNLVSARLSDVDIHGNKTGPVIVSGTTFQGADLSGAQLVRLQFDAPPSFAGVVAGVDSSGTCTTFQDMDLLEVSLTFSKVTTGCQLHPLLPGSTAPVGMIASIYRDPASAATRLNLTKARFNANADDRSSLAGLDLRDVNLSSSTFVGWPLDLSGATLDGAQLENTNLAGVQLSGASLKAVKAKNASFQGATLAPSGNHKVGATFAGSATDQTDVSDLSGANFVDAVVSGASFQSATLNGAVFDRVLAVGTSFNSVKAQNASFVGAHISGDGLAFEGADLSSVNFSAAVLVGNGSLTGGINFTRAPLQNATFNYAQCIGCNFTDAQLGGARFSEAWVMGAVFSGTALPSVDLNDAWLYCGDLEDNACLVPGSSPKRWTWPLALGSGEVSSQVPFEPTNFTGVSGQQPTTCPDGTSPKPTPTTGDGSDSTEVGICNGHLLPRVDWTRPGCSASAYGACPTPTRKLFDASSAQSKLLSVLPMTPPTWVTSLSENAGYAVGLDDGTVREVSSGSARILAGSAGQRCPEPTQVCGDGGPASQAQLGTPIALAVGLDGSLYIADSTLHRVRKIDPSGNITTIAGNGELCTAPGPTACGNGGAASKAQLSGPYGVWIDPRDRLVIADGSSGLRQVAADGTLSTLHGTDAYDVRSVVGDASGRLWAATHAPAEYLIQVDLGSGTVAPMVGTGTSGYNGNTDPNTDELASGTEVQINAPGGLSVDLDGKIVFADTGNNLMRAYRPDQDSVIDDLGGLVSNDGTPRGGFNGDCQWSNQVELNSPSAVTATGGPFLVVADTGNRRLLQLGPSPAVSTPPAPDCSSSDTSTHLSSVLAVHKPVATETPVAVHTPVATHTPAATHTPDATRTPVATHTPAATHTAGATPTPVATHTPVAAHTAAATPAASPTPRP